MKRCVSCQKEIPDPAMHCVFCGARQELQRTMMGYPAPGSWKGAASSPGPAVPPGPPAFAPEAPRPGFGGEPAPPFASGPPPAQYGAPEPRFAQHGVPPHQQFAPPQQFGPPPAYAEPAPPWATSAPARQAAWGEAAPYLPYEPWQRALRVVCAVFGMLLAVTFLAPRSFDPLVFGWDVFQGPLAPAVIVSLAVAVLGLVAALLGLLPASTSLRAFAAVLAGTGAAVAGILVAPEIHWRLVAYVAGLLIAAFGLLLRSQYRSSMAARVITTIGVLAFLAPHLVPEGGQVPLLITAQSLGDASGMALAGGLVILAIALVAVVSLIAVWLPPTTSGAGTALAWFMILAPALLLALPLLDDPGLLSAHPQGGYTILETIATRALSTYGLASLAGKLIETG